MEVFLLHKERHVVISDNETRQRTKHRAPFARLQHAPGRCARCALGRLGVAQCVGESRRLALMTVAWLEDCIVLITCVLHPLNSMLLAFLVDEVLLPPEIVVGKSTLQVVTSFV